MLTPKKRNPTHPGVILLEDFIKPLGLTPQKLATKLGADWTEKKINNIIEGKEHVCDKAAEAFASVFGTSSHFWIRLQQQCNHYDEVHRQNEKGSPKPWKKTG